MHATVNDLLKLRDREHVADAELIAHLRGCAECREQLARLKRTTELLRELPDRVRAPDRWDAIQAQLNASEPAHRSVREQVPPRARPGWWLPAASAAAVVVAVLLTLQPESPPATPVASSSVTPNPAATQGTSPTAPNGTARPAQLIAESQRLEEMLSSYSESPRVTRASTALTVADLEERIQWVDYRLNLGAEAGLDAAQSQKLWRERVELLNSLVAVRYAEAQTLAF
jgi:hypothetical protein